jgi:flagellar biosynthesis/type III secretory pathway protein FliH
VLDLYRLDIKAFHNPNDQMYEQLQAEHESLEKEYNQALLDLVIALFYRRRKTS